MLSVIRIVDFAAEINNSVLDRKDAGTGDGSLTNLKHFTDEFGGKHVQARCEAPCRPLQPRQNKHGNVQQNDNERSKNKKKTGFFLAIYSVVVLCLNLQRYKGVVKF